MESGSSVEFEHSFFEGVVVRRKANPERRSSGAKNRLTLRVQMTAAIADLFPRLFSFGLYDFPCSAPCLRSSCIVAVYPSHPPTYLLNAPLNQLPCISYFLLSTPQVRQLSVSPPIDSSSVASSNLPSLHTLPCLTLN